MKPTLYLDEDVSSRLAPLLRAQGVDCVAPREIGTEGRTDPEHLVRATADGRVIFTYNCADFERLAKEWGARGDVHAGIIASYHQYRRHELGRAVREICAFLDEYDADHLHNLYLVLPSPARAT